MILGVDYYPEHWPIEMLAEDIERIVKMGANTVRIGEFAWHLMEPVEGEFDFSFFDSIIEALKKSGLSVIFGTPTATFPAWFAKKYPNVIAVNGIGVSHAFGGRRLYCYNAPEYLRLTERIVTKLVDHYKNEPAIIAWQIDNELGHEGSDQCYCPQCETGFQSFLKD
ncbi:MAG TPA: beta-galactosidase, partial [Clostridiales bacterium UBA8960]|nr:beta-galactosidase [Clostridiales bacterium UBA8960]